MKQPFCLKRVEDETGAVAADWVVLTAAIVGLGVGALAGVSGGVQDSSDDIATTLSAQITDTAAQAASYFYALGMAAHPDDKTDAWRAARDAVADAAPDGYEYDPEYQTTRYVDTVSGYPIYVSDSGAAYSIGGQVVAASDYDNSDRQSFYSAFSDAWNAQ